MMDRVKDRARWEWNFRLMLDVDTKFSIPGTLQRCIAVDVYGESVSELHLGTGPCSTRCVACGRGGGACGVHFVSP